MIQEAIKVGVLWSVQQGISWYWLIPPSLVVVTFTNAC